MALAIDTIQLSAALRIGDGATPPGEPLQSILSRYIGVAEAFISIDAPGAPDSIKDESIIRMAAYLYDQPSAGRGDAFANAWRNSGAGALVQRWKVVRVAQ